jgi:hypothetical protein
MTAYASRNVIDADPMTRKMPAIMNGRIMRMHRKRPF